MDRNCGQVAVAYSDGTHEIHRQPKTKSIAARIKRCQRKLKRQKKGSNRRSKTKARIAKLHRRIKNIGNNWRHRLSRHVADKARLVVLENLSTQSMTKSARGTVENPGSNVKQKAGLNRSILSTGWGELQQMLAYKTQVAYVNPASTSQTCAKCGYRDKSSRKTQAAFHCTHCGHQDNADLNAAQNIMASGVGATGQGAVSLK